MGGILYLIGGGATAAVGWVGGLLTYYVRFRAQLLAIERDKAAIERERAEMRRADAKEFWDAFDKRIATLKERLAGAKDEERETIQSRLCGAQDECEETLKAWQRTQELAALVPRALVGADEPKRTPEEAAKVGELLVGSARLPPVLLSADDYSTRGNAYYNAGDYEQALEAYNRALELRPDHPSTLGIRGVTLRRLGRYEEALKDYNRVLEVRPDDALTLSNRSGPLIKLGRYEDGLRDIKQALQLRPGDPVALYNRACAYSLMGRFEDALRDLEGAIRADEKRREEARSDEDFEKLRNDPEYGPRFRKLVGE
jgi:tetratricopeptide (TPR) repeat protein